MDNLDNLTIRVVTDRKQFSEIKQPWLDLQQKLGASFYTNFYFYRAYFKHITSPDVTPFLVVAFKGDRLVGLLPWEKRRRTFLGINYYEIGTLDHPHVDLNGILYEVEYESAILKSLHTLKNQLPTLSIFCLPKLKKDSQLATLISSQHQMSAFNWQTSESKYIDFGQTPLPEVIPKRHLKNINRLLRKSQKEGIVEFSFTQGKDITQEQIRNFLEIEASGWKGKQGSNSAIMLNKHLLAFYHSLFKNNKKNIQLNCYYFNNTPIAAHFCFINNDTLSLAKVCYLQEYSNLSPSHVLIYKAMENAQIKGKVKKISFVTGPTWLAPWKPEATPVHTFIFPMGLLSSMIYQIAKYSRLLINKLHKKSKN